MSAARRALPVLLAAAAATGLVAGCGAGGARTAPAASSGALSAAGSSSPVGGSSLAKGLLPADAFGSGTTVVGLDVEQLAHRAGGFGGMPAGLAGITVTPPECATAMMGVAPQLAGLRGGAAKTATGQGAVTVEALVSGGPAATAVGTVQGLLRTCSQVQVTAPKKGSASVALQPVPVGDLADGATGFRVTATLTRNGGAARTLPGLVGLVRDGDRLLLLATAGTNGTPPDTAAFTALLQKAVSTEQKALD